MKQRKINWVFLAIVTTIALILVAHSLRPLPKARARRIQAVNSLTKVSIIVTNSNALPGAIGRASPGPTDPRR